MRFLDTAFSQVSCRFVSWEAGEERGGQADVHKKLDNGSLCIFMMNRNSAWIDPQVKINVEEDKTVLVCLQLTQECNKSRDVSELAPEFEGNNFIPWCWYKIPGHFCYQHL